MLQFIKKTASQKILKQKKLVSEIIGRWHRYQQLIHQNWMTITTALLFVALFSLILYMLVSPLPGLFVPNFSDKQPITSSTRQSRFLASLDTYVGLLRTRDLFKPSIPIPDEKKTAKTTAEQLAQRLQFLGVSGNEQNLSALVFIPERGPDLFQIGDRVAEFILRDIDRDSLVLQLEDEQIILKR